MDIFNETILCKSCGVKMKQGIVNHKGFQLRAVRCPSCNKKIIHPADLNSAEDFKNLKGKTYKVKLRVIGNSHAISIPKEIVNFIKHQEREVDEFNNIVRLCFEDMNKLSLNFRNLNDGEF